MTKDNKRIAQLKSDYKKLNKTDRKRVQVLLDLVELGVIKIDKQGNIHRTKFGYAVKKELVKQGVISK